MEKRIISLNFDEDTLQEITNCCENTYFHSNISKFIGILFNNAKKNNLKLILENGKEVKIRELCNFFQEQYYSFQDIQHCNKRITKNFKENFNNIKNEELKKQCYHFIKSIVEFLYMEGLRNNIETLPSIGTSENISIYDCYNQHVIYISVKNTDSDFFIIISKLMQMKYTKNQTQYNKLWEMICSYLNVEDCVSAKVDAQQILEITNLIKESL